MLVVMNELERFRATVHHEPHCEFLFHAGFNPDFERRVREYFGVGEGDDIREFLGMYNPVMPELRPPEGYAPPGFSEYFDGVAVCPGCRGESCGCAPVLKVPRIM